MSTDSVIIAPAEVREFCIRSMNSVQTKNEHSKALADVLLAADYSGHYSHGLNRLEMYVDDIKANITSKSNEPRVISEKGATAFVDGMNCLGPVVGNFSMDIAINKALQVGVGWVAAKGSNHYGIAGWYSQKACDKGLLGMSFTNTSPLAFPTRSKQVAVGTNPLALAAPGEKESDNFLLDMATTAVALGKIEMARRKKEPIPEGWAADANGKVTKIADEGAKGGLLPLGGVEITGGYKGYGLAMLVEIFCGILSGSLYGPQIRKWGSVGTEANLGQGFVAIDPNAFTPGFKTRMSDFANILRNLPKSDQNLSVLIPGDKERKCRKLCDENGGILYPMVLIESMNTLAKKLNIGPMKILKVVKKINSSSYTENLKVFDKLEGHKGCVNTVAWDKTGTKILSGGDDMTLRIHQYMSDWDISWMKNEIHQIVLPNSRNILSAKFMPIYSNQVVSASKCGSIFFLDIDHPINELSSVYKHAGAVLNVETPKCDPFNFITVSNDKTCCIFDIRESFQNPSVKLTFPCSLSTVTSHPIDSNKIAIGGSDSCVRIFDRRNFNESYFDVEKTLKKVKEVCRPLQFALDVKKSNSSPFHEYGRRCINSLSFEPKTGNYLLVNYMYDSIYLFDIRQQEDGQQLLSEADNLPENNTSLFRVHYNWANTGPPRDGENNENSEILCPPSIQSFLNELQLKESSLSNETFNTPYNLEAQLKSIKRYKQIQVYDGHQNFRTMIKDSRFWGSKYILSGSECGHIIVWEKNKSNPIVAIPTDQRVTNRIEPHPFLPIIATCGIDYNVKIVGSTLQSEKTEDEKKESLKRIINQNQFRTERAKQSQSISMMDLLRIMRAQRIIQRINNNSLGSSQ